MYGKFFSSAFTGSMLGSGPVVFSVWGYVIANTVNSQVELNPILLATLIGTSREEVDAAIAFLCAPDPRSRSKVHNGCRLIKEGEFAYRVPTHDFYRGIRNEEERREYNRNKKAEQRQREKKVVVPVKDRVIDKSSDVKMSAQAEAETEAEAKKRGASAPVCFPSSLNHEDFKAKWSEYVEYRKHAKLKALASESMQKQFKQMVIWGKSAAMEAIDKAITMGWQGIFPPKGKPRGTKLTSSEKKQLADAIRDEPGAYTIVNDERIYSAECRRKLKALYDDKTI